MPVKPSTPTARLVFVVIAVAAAASSQVGHAQTAPGTGKASPFSDYRSQRPGVTHRITPADLPPPGATESADNGPRLVKRPKDAWPQAPQGFKVELYADGLAKPRLARTAPNGDVVRGREQGRPDRVLRGVGPDGRAKQVGGLSPRD